MIVELSAPSAAGAWRESFRSASLLATLLAGTCLTPMAALAQSTNNWIGTTPAYATTTNWQNSAIPLSSETAVFSTLGTARSLAIGTGTSVGGWQFSAGTPAYTFSVQNTYQFLTTGIVNSSSNAPVVYGASRNAIRRRTAFQPAPSSPTPCSSICATTAS